MESTAVLILDVQQGLLARHPYHRKNFLANISQLIDAAHDTKTEVIYLQQTDKDLPEGSADWALAQPLAPLPQEKVFKKHYGSAFRESELKEHLDARGIRTLILAGLETEYSIDTTCKVAFEYGYSVIIPMDTNTTFDTCFSRAKQTITWYQEGIWAGRYAAVFPLKEVIKQLAR